MISKAIIKDIQNLTHKDSRDDQGLFLAEGDKWAEELLGLVPQNIQCLYAKKNWLDSNASRLKGIQVEEVDDIMLSRLSQLRSPQDVLIVSKQFKRTIEPATGGLHLALSTIQDPGNLGTLIRTADWFGIKQIVCSPDCVDQYNPKVVQATMGSLIRVSVCYTPLTDWISAQQGVRKWAAVLHGKNYSTVTGEGILLLGNESKGLSEELLSLATDPITIPRIGGAESLNVSVAAGILLAQLTR
ncbi:MAG: TrmH family RNA methyltransferase [Bacteroidota bacterium]